MLSALIFSLFLATGAAQHHHGHDPFSGSGCTCETFCQNKCAINATKPENKTFYRMTPFGVWDMINKDTGDAKGDTSFVLSRKTVAYECRKDPDSFMCKDVTQFKGDDPNSTDVIQEFKIEIDGQWGPYLYCNPVNISDSLGPWHCTVELGYSGGGTPSPPQCQANFSVYGGYCFEGNAKNVSVSDLGACCAAASAAGTEHFTYYKDAKICALFEGWYPRYERCRDGMVGSHHSQPNVCNCTRVHRTLGRENLTSSMSHYSSQRPAGGEWYSHPIQGRCTGSQRVGDGSGCTWRVVERVRSIKATCMYKRLDASVEGSNPSCFADCGPRNVTSTCYLRCFSEAVNKLTHDQLAAPWLKAFASSDPAKGGCPDTPDEWY